MTNLYHLFDLTNKVALVTGGSRGLGKEMAEGLAEAGAALMLVARREEWLKPTVAEMQARGLRCEGILADVAQPADIQRVVEHTLRTYGQIDILINNAGVSWGAPAEDMPLDKWQMVLDINLTGPFLLCQAVGREMIKRQFGRIINIASLSALLAPPGQANYAAAKAGVVALTQSLAKEVARIGITVNVLCPGYIETGALAAMGEEDRRRALEKVPMRRFGRPEEIAAAVRFLACADAAYITGSTLKIDGGIL